MAGPRPFPNRPFPRRIAAPLPLEGVRILSVEQYGAGPFGTLYLADLGAEVVKIEPPQGGDVSRASGPHYLGEGDSQFFQTFNRNKRSITLDLKHPDGQALLHRLVPRFDAVMNNLRGDQPAKLGLTYARLGPVKPSLVCAHLSAYGREGPRAAWPGYDYLMQAEAGFLSVTGEPGGPPARMGLSIIDYMTGITCSLALLAALLGAARTGRGRDVDVCLYDVAMHQLSYPATWYLNEGDVTGRRPRSGHPSVVPTETAADRGRLDLRDVRAAEVLGGAGEAFGLPELPVDPRFAKGPARPLRQPRRADGGPRPDRAHPHHGGVDGGLRGAGAGGAGARRGAGARQPLLPRPRRRGPGAASAQARLRDGGEPGAAWAGAAVARGAGAGGGQRRRSWAKSASTGPNWRG
jgi:succinate---hydroxymethylglutarate CoA-transferase